MRKNTLLLMTVTLTPSVHSLFVAQSPMITGIHARCKTNDRRTFESKAIKHCNSKRNKCNNVGFQYRQSMTISRRTNRLYMSPFELIADEYTDALNNYPMITKACTGFILCGIADVIAQIKSQIPIKRTINSQRVIRFATKGIFSALIWGSWYDFSNTLISNARITTYLGLAGFSVGEEHFVFILAFVKTILLILMEQFVACPILFALWEIPAATVLNRAPLDRIPYEIEHKLSEMLIANAKVWTVANFLIYNVPVQYRVGISNVIDIFWQSIVSNFAADCGKNPDDETYLVEGIAFVTATGINGTDITISN